MRIILASGSPRRRELLSQIGIEYEVKVSEADEDSDITDPAKLVEELSYRKAMAVAKELSDKKAVAKELSDWNLIIGADTVVSIDGKVLGKPKSPEDAVAMLCKLSGRHHQVYTGVTFIKNVKDKDFTEHISFHECTEVFFYEMSESEIREYVDTKDPLDKAGAYGIQGFCARYIEKIEGDYNNVVGLPVGRLYQELKGFAGEYL